MSIPRTPTPRTDAPTRMPPPRNAEDARQRFYVRYGWPLIVAAIGREAAGAMQPTTVEGWIALAEQVRDYLNLSPSVRLAEVLERAATELRQAEAEQEER